MFNKTWTLTMSYIFRYDRISRFYINRFCNRVKGQIYALIELKLLLLQILPILPMLPILPILPILPTLPILSLPILSCFPLFLLYRVFPRNLHAKANLKNRHITGGQRGSKPFFLTMKTGSKFPMDKRSTKVVYYSQFQQQEKSPKLQILHF